MRISFFGYLEKIDPCFKVTWLDRNITLIIPKRGQEVIAYEESVV